MALVDYYELHSILKANGYVLALHSAALILAASNQKGTGLAAG
jgi:hypothetical protein